MRTKIIVVVLSLLSLTACGSDDVATATAPGACANSPLVGEWHGTALGQPDTIVFKADCTGTASVCGATFQYNNTTVATGVTSISVSSNNGTAGCLPVGTITCGYSVGGGAFAYNCGGGAIAYTH